MELASVGHGIVRILANWATLATLTWHHWANTCWLFCWTLEPTGHSEQRRRQHTSTPRDQQQDVSYASSSLLMWMLYELGKLNNTSNLARQMECSLNLLDFSHGPIRTESVGNGGKTWKVAADRTAVDQLDHHHHPTVIKLPLRSIS